VKEDRTRLVQAEPGRGSPGTGTRSPDPPATWLDIAAKAASPSRVKLPSSALLNMELSILAFNERVLELALDSQMPLLERVRFLSIFGSNLDEFFMTRVAGFKRQVALNNEKPTLDGVKPREQLRLIDECTRALLDAVYTGIIPTLVEQLREEGLEVIRWKQLNDEEREYLRSNYAMQLDAVIAPVYVRRGAPFPHIRNLRPAFLAQLPASAGEREDQFAILELPGDVPRLLPLPGGRRFTPLEDVIRASLPRLIGASEPVDAHLFRVTRSGNLSLDAENIEDIVEAVAENVALRPFQPVVRIEVEERMPPERREYLLTELRKEARSRLSDLGEEDVFTVHGPIDLERLRVVGELPISSLRFPPQKRSSPFRRDIPILEQLKKRNVLVRFPRHSFERTVERFIREAANDPDVEQIYVTLYRTSRSSRVVRLLRSAQGKGKSVTALVEVKASFDEQRNIEWARSLESAGIRVLYGSPSLKVHAKIASVSRREGNERRIYSYIGTGNLNAATAAAYTDLGVFTADPEVGRELDDLFATMAGDREQHDYPSLLVAPFNMRECFLRKIEREVQHAMAGRSAGLSVKLNGIADKEIIAELYRASAAGVQVDLIVRGVCALRPAVPGLSERIRVVAIAGRFLEHSRIFRFHNDGDAEYYIGSADWRGRNLSRRVEVAVPILDPKHRARLDAILKEDLNRKDAWDLRADGRYVRRNPQTGIVRLPGTSALAELG
jgi:polyphosphate kinase